MVPTKQQTISIPAGEPPELVDTHCHLDMDVYQNDLESILALARGAGVCQVVTIGIDYQSSQEAVELAKNHPAVYATIGLHPHSASEASTEGYDLLGRLASHPKVIGFGEIGLDYAREYSPRANQQREFTRQLALAKKNNLPIVIHDRDAHQDTLAILREYGPFPAGGVMHCFSGDTALAWECIQLGLHLSIPGIVTFPKGQILQQVVRDIPLDHLLIETDGPFLAPVPFRGKRNQPAYLIHTAQKIAELQNVSFGQVAQRTTANARSLFPALGKASLT